MKNSWNFVRGFNCAVEGLPCFEPFDSGLKRFEPLVVATETRLEPGTPVVLFPTGISGGGVDSQQGRQYDVTRDGRFLINTVLDNASAPITLLQNWNPELKK